jgi:hypothetical protein
MMEEQRTFRQKVDRLLEMFSPAFDWNAFYEQDESGEEESIDDLFLQCCTVGFPGGEEESGKYFECGSEKVDDTPNALYRLLYLLKPKHLDFSDMYKGGLFGFFSADKRFLVSIEFFKYELGLYFYCPKEALTGRGSVVQGGWPGCDNGTSCGDEDGKAFFEMVTRAVHREWDVYSGNNFTV